MRDFLEANWMWMVYGTAAVVLAFGLVYRFNENFRRRVDDYLNQEVVMARKAMIADFVWRAFLAFGAVTVMVLWYQAATRDEEADRNARIQACSAAYAGTFDAHAGLFFETAVAAGPNPPPEVVADIRFEARASAQMAKRRIGLAAYSAASVAAGNDFVCPPIPDELVVDPIPPDDTSP